MHKQLTNLGMPISNSPGPNGNNCSDRVDDGTKFGTKIVFNALIKTGYVPPRIRVQTTVIPSKDGGQHFNLIRAGKHNFKGTTMKPGS